ncbi:tRNA pseudouridine synthase A [soil metagenome]
MPRYQVVVAYDGTDFCGWQKQEPLAHIEDAAPRHVGADQPTAPTRAYAADTPLIDSSRTGRVALRTVQGVLESAVRHAVRERVELVGASRTDSGVHARGQVAAFTCAPRAGAHAEPGVGWPIERGPERLAAALNSRLPPDLIIVSAALAPDDFDPISDVERKGYSYTFHVSRLRPLFDRAFVHHIRHPGGFDLDALSRAAALFVGTHDFAAFAAAGHGRLSTVRTVHECRITVTPANEFAGIGAPPSPAPAPSTSPSASAFLPGAPPAPAEFLADTSALRVRLDISGNGFLWNMVRIIAGTLMQVGIRKRTLADVTAALESQDRRRAGPTLAADGLCLEWIRYRQRAAIASSVNPDAPA